MLLIERSVGCAEGGRTQKKNGNGMEEWPGEYFWVKCLQMECFGKKDEFALLSRSGFHLYPYHKQDAIKNLFIAYIIYMFLF